VTVAQAPPLGEHNAFAFELLGFSDTGGRVLGVLNERQGTWTSSTVVVYDFEARTVQTRNVNDRVGQLAPDDCPVYGDPIGLVSGDTVAVVVGSDDLDAAIRCVPEAQWELHVRTGELRRVPAGARVMRAGTRLDHPRGPQTSGSRSGP
jgi:hypothetical protein